MDPLGEGSYGVLGGRNGTGSPGEVGTRSKVSKVPFPEERKPIRVQSTQTGC